jgi:hypothetical protein
LTHQTAPRSIADITDGGFGPGTRLHLTRFGLGHVLIGGFELRREDVGTHQLFAKAANAPTANDSMEPIVDSCVKGDSALFLPKTLLQKVYVFYTYSKSSWADVKGRS